MIRQGPTNGERPSRVLELEVLDGILVGLNGNAWRLLASEFRAAGDSRAERASPSPLRVEDGVARIALRGVLSRSVYSGEFATNLADVEQLLERALEADEVHAVVLDCDSPGGTFPGVPELAGAIREGLSRKPIVALIDGQAEGTAYWLASQAARIGAVRSARVGGIGLTRVVRDSSRAFESAGIDVRVLSTGPHKGAGEPGSRVTLDQLRGIEDGLEEAWRMFRSDLDSARPQLGRFRRELHGGRVYLAERAQQLGLVDEVAPRAQLERGARLATLRRAPSKAAPAENAEQRAVRAGARDALARAGRRSVRDLEDDAATRAGVLIVTGPSSAGSSPAWPTSCAPQLATPLADQSTAGRVLELEDRARQTLEGVEVPTMSRRVRTCETVAERREVLKSESFAHLIARELWENRALARDFEHDPGARAKIVERVWSHADTRRLHNSEAALEAYLLACAQRRCCRPF